MKRDVLSAYRRGWIDGAGFMGLNGDHPEPAEDYQRGFRSGRSAFHAAMAEERRRLGLPSANVLHAAAATSGAVPTGDGGGAE